MTNNTKPNEITVTFTKAQAERILNSLCGYELIIPSLPEHRKMYEEIIDRISDALRFPYDRPGRT